MPVVIDEEVLPGRLQPKRPRDEAGGLGAGQLTVRAEPVVGRRVAADRDGGVGDAIDRPLEHVTLVIHEMVALRGGQGKGSGDHRRHLGPRQHSAGAKTIVERRVAPDRYPLRGDGFDATLVDDLIVVGEGPTGRQRGRGEQRSHQGKGGEE